MAANPDPAPKYTPKWDADPVVLCSRRSRIIPFPTLLLLRQPTEAEARAIAAPPELGKVYDTGHMTVDAGANFLGAMTTAWDPQAFRAASSQAVPRGAPSVDHCILVAPHSRSINIERRAGFVDRDTGLVIPSAVHAAWMRVLDWLRAQEAAQIAGPAGQANVPLFTAEQGYDAPEFVVCKLSEMLSQRTEAGQHAYQHAHGAIPHAKDGAHLGALHDYAARTTTGWTLAVACRARATQQPGLMRRMA